MSTDTINIDALRAATLHAKPYPYVIVPGFIKADALEGIEADYPAVELPGSFPLPTLEYGPRFARLMDEIAGPEMTETLGSKLGVSLANRPTMITVRGQCRASDGQIHTDSSSKLVTVLLYMNGQWEKPGGRLRLLRSPDNLNDAFAEVPPEKGTLLAFLNQPNAWHGHESCEGPRRAIQLNWVRDRGVVWYEQNRHRVSAFFKRLKKR